MKNCKLFSNPAPMQWWLNQVQLNHEEHQQIEEGCKFIQKLNKDIHDLDNHHVESAFSLNYIHLKNELLKLSLGYNIDFYDYDVILKKRSTIHIRELFAKHVDDDTLVIASSFQHTSAEKVIDTLPNVFKLDEEHLDSSVYTCINAAVKEATKYKKIFVYLIATEFQTGRNYSQDIYDKLYSKIKDLGKEVIFVLDAVQEMFLLPRDWSKYDYILGTAHATYFNFDTGFLFINRKLQSAKGLTGYKRDDVLSYLVDGLKIVLKRHKYIMMYNKIISDSIDHDLFENCKLHNSQANFYSMYLRNDSLLSNPKALSLIEKKFIKPALTADPGVNVEISHHKPYDELYVRLRAQTLMFDKKDISEKLNYFTKNWKALLSRR